MTFDEKIAEANRLGLSYGQYVAQYHPAGKAPEQTEPPQKAPEKLCCVVCGARLKGRQRKYCSKSCTQENYRSVGRWCAMCGKAIGNAPGRSRYCSPECRRIAKNKSRQINHLKKKASRNRCFALD